MARLPGIIRQAVPGTLFIVATGTFLAFLGPYGSSELGWPGVWIYWTGMIAFGALCGQMASRMLTPISSAWPGWLIYVLVSVFVSIPITGAVLTIQALFGDPHPITFWPLIFLFVWVISGGVTTLSYLVDRARANTIEPAQTGRALLDKLPVRLKTAEIWALESEDHYLRVHTSKGDALVLMRLVDAMAAVEPLEGMQTHRSWWVARIAIEDANPESGRAVLTLKDGKKAPVSRSFYPEMRKQGWI